MITKITLINSAFAVSSTNTFYICYWWWMGCCNDRALWKVICCYLVSDTFITKYEEGVYRGSSDYRFRIIRYTLISVRVVFQQLASYFRMAKTYIFCSVCRIINLNVQCRIFNLSSDKFVWNGSSFNVFSFIQFLANESEFLTK